MRFVRFNGDRLGLLTDDDRVVDLTDHLDLTSNDPLKEVVREDIDVNADSLPEPEYDLADVRLESPVRRPGKVIAAPLNYEDHVAEMEDFDMDIKEAGYFLKSPSSVIGPEDTIELPFVDRRCDYEVELAFVMEDDVKDVASDDVWDSVLGYTILLDISVRGDQDRSNRKSYDTFTVIGPVVVTVDELENEDPHDLDMELQLNGETRQQQNTGNMIYNCGDVVQYASIGTTIEAGDVITTGTPSGVGELSGGDTIDAEIEGIGSMTVDVEERDVRFADVDVKKSQQNE
ncbi:2-keto-4-pentenoate hydratase/2-oxohepta-3-ene-1,7-dioic acid hydratase (catechol pathway) [Halopenitus malekzadehii]|uniref:2-keto-4-pentenoate hydratase/2-oxohepta-3-ene-1,7-dioic acid hydratase (Catechol pathway) n=1 Tax=Halopenitus malekzadehii TaxID=1267564 RepID=A0A1H6JX78_9EURY|nr:fumarylacetoacetate hydrolase family protein [Halopenitus malekzadehii]SEH65613.1 2-keto-4-pentenoate hydratase/2-oxohepta-3-ene-1,7-dioic acid hydratase (catechol pathway) [Halopenitus malekzadehii]